MLNIIDHQQFVLYINIQMKKYLGINRNRFSTFQQAKYTIIKKKNRFKDAGKEDLSSQTVQGTSILTSTTQNSATQESIGQGSKIVELYDLAKESITIVGQLKKKIANECKMRLTVFKQSQTKKYDQNIASLTKKTVNHILKAERALNQIRKIKGSNIAQEKYYRNMQKSLILCIRECSKDLRIQEKEYFDRLSTYEKGTKNKAIQLSESQKQKMKDSYLDFDECEQSSIQLLSSETRTNNINQLVQSINKLSTIYKQLNQMVIEQGSIIDRIDFNIDETLFHVSEGKEHLRKADQKASSSCAEKCMLVLVAIIIILAVILGFKYCS